MHPMVTNIRLMLEYSPFYSSFAFHSNIINNALQMEIIETSLQNGMSEMRVQQGFICRGLEVWVMKYWSLWSIVF